MSITVSVAGAAVATQWVTVAIAAAEPYIAAVQIVGACVSAAEKVLEKIEEHHGEEAG
jgi:hypothetical protein